MARLASTRARRADVSEHIQKDTQEVDALSPQKEKGRRSEVEGSGQAMGCRGLQERRVERRNSGGLSGLSVEWGSVSEIGKKRKRLREGETNS